MRVSELALGSMTFGDGKGWTASKEDSKKMFDVFVETGGNLIDTANFYNQGLAETYIGEFIEPIREQIVLSTKFGLSMRPGDINSNGNHRKNIFESVEKSLKRLNTDYIDILWVHMYDGITPVEEMMRALDDLVRMGKVHYLGISNAPAWFIAHANTLAEKNNWTSFVAMQLPYNLVQRDIEREYIDLAKTFHMSILAWSPLGGGILSGKYNDKNPKNARITPDGEWSFLLQERSLEIAEVVNRIAKSIDCSPAQVALNWIRQKKCIPILGVRTAEQIKENLDCLEFTLSEEDIQKLDEISTIELGYPHDFLNSPFIKKVAFDSTSKKLI